MASKVVIKRLKEEHAADTTASAGTLYKEKLTSIVTCPVCLYVPRTGPLIECENGHIVCHACHESLPTTPKQCPTCRTEFDEEPKRSLIAEQLLDMVDKACENNALEGCPFTGKNDQLRVHEEEECPRRRVPCPLILDRSKCKFKMFPFEELMDHVYNHNANTTTTTTTAKNKVQEVASTVGHPFYYVEFPAPGGENGHSRRNSRQRTWLLQPVLFLTADIYVHVLLHLYQIGDVFSTYAQIVGPKSLAELYQIKVSIEGGNLQFRQKCSMITADDRVKLDATTRKILVNGVRCYNQIVTFTSEQVHSCVGGDQVWKVLYEVVRKE